MDFLHHEILIIHCIIDVLARLVKFCLHGLNLFLEQDILDPGRLVLHLLLSELGYLFLLPAHQNRELTQVILGSDKFHFLEAFLDLSDILTGMLIRAEKVLGLIENGL